MSIPVKKLGGEPLYLLLFANGKHDVPRAALEPEHASAIITIVFLIHQIATEIIRNPHLVQVRINRNAIAENRAVSAEEAEAARGTRGVRSPQSRGVMDECVFGP